MSTPTDGQKVYELFADLLKIAYDGLQDTRLGIPNDAVLSHDEPPEDGCCDFLAVWVREWAPYPVGTFPAGDFNTASGACLPLEWGPTVVLSLRRPCAPSLKDDQYNPFPEPGEETAAAADLIIDARNLLCTVTTDWVERLNIDYPGARLAYDTMRPTGSATNCFGWDWDIKIELSGSCRSVC